jgi:predicted Zn-dependent protease
MRAGLAKAHAFAKEDPVNPTYDIVSGELYETAGRRGEALELLEKTVAARPSADALIEVLSSFYARRAIPARRKRS